MRDRIITPAAPAAIGPYSQGIRFSGELVFTAGQIPLDPATKSVVGGGIRAQTEQVLKNLQAILVAAGTSLEHAIKTTVFLKNFDDFAAMNEVYSEYFSADPPARSTVEVARLPKDVLIEIECLALIP
jgi:2-iminobutanoate/2-iminopropanoate deaminase